MSFCRCCMKYRRKLHFQKQKTFLIIRIAGCPLLALSSHHCTPNILLHSKSNEIVKLLTKLSNFSTDGVRADYDKLSQ